MGNQSSRSCLMVRWGNEDEERLVQEFSDWFPEMKAEPCCFAHSADHGVSLEIVNRSMSFIRHLNEQSMEVCFASPHGRWKDQLPSRLQPEFLRLSVEANKFLDTLLTNMKDVNQELCEFLDAILNWMPLPHGEEEILAKLRRFQSRESFSEQFLQSFRDLMEIHKGIVEMVQQPGTSLQKKVKALKWLRKVIYAALAGFFVAVLSCSILVAALQACPVLESVVAAASSAASWGPLALWVDELWVRKLNELRLMEKEPCTVWLLAVVGKKRVLPELKPIFSLVNELEGKLSDNVHFTLELRSMKERLQKKLCEGIDGINDAIEKVEDCKTELDGTNELLNWMMGGSNGGQSKIPNQEKKEGLDCTGSRAIIAFSSQYLKLGDAYVTAPKQSKYTVVL